MNGDIIEFQIDRAVGILSLRIFRNQKWTDYLQIPVVSGTKSGDLNFGVSTNFQGVQMSLVDKPNEWPVKS